MWSYSVLFTLLSQVSPQCQDPWCGGPYDTKHEIYGYLNTGLNAQLGIWNPTAPGNFPIVYFLSGGANLIPASAYGDVLANLASHGVVIVSAWEINSENYQGEWLVEIEEWVTENLEGKLQTNGASPDFRIDFENTILMGHSAGAHIAVEYLKHHCNNVKAQILLSPVDGADPFGLIDNYCITPGELLNYDIPTLIMPTGLDSVPGINLGNIVPACAPSDLSNQRFYDAMRGPTWWVNSTGYGHGDLLNEFYYQTLLATHICATNGDMDREIYKSYIGGEVFSFISAVVYGDCDSFQFFEEPSTIPVDVEVKKKGIFQCSVEVATCVWQPEKY